MSCRNYRIIKDVFFLNLTRPISGIFTICPNKLCGGKMLIYTMPIYKCVLFFILFSVRFWGKGSKKWRKE